MNVAKEFQQGEVTERKWYILGIELWKINETKVSKTYSFLKIPILKVKRSAGKYTCKLFCFLPVYGHKVQGKEMFSCKLFGFIPVYRYKTTTKDCYLALNKHYDDTLRVLSKRAKQGNKIRVGFYIIEVFQYASVYEAMLKSDFFEPFIVVVPDVMRKSIMQQTMETTYNMLSSKYPNVYMGYDFQAKKGLDFSDKMDIVFFGNPYCELAHPYHFVWHMLKRNILTCFQNYGFFTLLFGREHIASLPFFNACWKVFTDSEENYRDLVEHQIRKGANAHVAGYFKMDKLAVIEPTPSDRPRVLLCPHHTIDFKLLQLSNFLRLADFFLELPSRYPQVDFIFRPHQLLHYNLTQYWSQERADAYYEKMMAHPNVSHDTGQDYMQTFVNSDAIIHDCGSFTAEYLFVNKPSCYMLRDEEEVRKTFLPMGQKCLNQYYLAYNEQDICRFIEDVVLKGNDPLKEQRTEFSKKLKYNYPHAGEKVVEYIRKQIENCK